MICARCATAADHHAPTTQHCTSPYCTCQHRTDRYQSYDGFAVIAAFYDQLDSIARQEAARVEAAIARVEADHQPDDTIAIPRVTEAQYRQALPGRYAQIAGQLMGQLLTEEERAAGIHFAIETTED
jgi:hypothetical protein